MSKKGITLIELVAVIVIIAIIASFVIPTITGLINRQKDRADEAIIDSLNEATRLYILGEQIVGDPFIGLESNSQRLNILFAYGYLSSLPQPNQQGTSFLWDTQLQKWIIHRLTEDTASVSLPQYDFKETRLIGMIEIGSSISQGNFIDQGDSITSTFGLMYIPNPLETYTLTVSAQLLSIGNSGGYGLLFDTTVNNLSTQSDTGYALQFDRGLGAIVIRPRNNGKEGNRVADFPILFDQGGSGNFVLSEGTSNRYHSWWNELHTLKIVVATIQHPSYNKKASIYLDNIFLFDFHFESSIIGDVANQNYTGFRTWGNNEVAFYSLVVS